MSRNLASKTGLTDFLIIWNRTTAVAHAHDAETANTEVAVSAEDAVQKSDIIWSCIGGDDAIKNVIESVVKGDVKGQLFVDCSTTSVQSTKEVADRVPAHGAEFVAMPGRKILVLAFRSRGMELMGSSIWRTQHGSRGHPHLRPGG